MQLPTHLRMAVDEALEGIPLAALQQAAEALSLRYREDRPATAAHLSSERMTQAYLAVRLPATYAAIRQSLEWVHEALPEFAPTSLLDAGSGPGTALFAGADLWPGLEQALLLEGSGAIRTAGERLVSAAASATEVEWRAADLAKPDVLPDADLTVCAYVLTELAERARAQLVDRLWHATTGVLLLVEPGTPAGWKRILAARSQLIEAGAQIVAPCPHMLACPLQEPDWCHFARRVARSRMHRLVKQGDVPWEDEKFIYLAASRTPGLPIPARVLTQPKVGKGLVEIKLCNQDGSATLEKIRKRDDRYKAARRADWGDTL